MDWFRYFLTLNPDLQVSDIDYTTYELLFNQSAEAFSSVLATDNPDLFRFRENGGKLIILHGLADHLITPLGTIEYYTRMQQYMGGREKTTAFARLFLLPGLDHNFDGIAPKPVRQMDALVNWVEKGIAPDAITAEHKNKSGNLEQSKQILPY